MLCQGQCILIDLSNLFSSINLISLIVIQYKWHLWMPGHATDNSQQVGEGKLRSCSSLSRESALHWSLTTIGWFGFSPIAGERQQDVVLVSNSTAPLTTLFGCFHTEVVHVPFALLEWLSHSLWHTDCYGYVLLGIVIVLRTLAMELHVYRLSV